MASLRVNLQRLHQSSKRRFGQSSFGLGALLIALAASIAYSVSVFNHGMALARHSHQDEANGHVLCAALGFEYMVVGNWNEDEYVIRETVVRAVTPNGPFDRAGLKRDDRIPLHLRTVKTLTIQRRGKTIVLPVRRAGRRFTVTVSVPRFTLPYPKRAFATSVASDP